MGNKINDSEELVLKANEFFNNFGMSFQEYIQYFGSQYLELLKMDKETLQEFNLLLKEIKLKCGTPQERGKKFEALIYCLLFNGTSKLFECLKNVRTSTNEIDLLVQLSHAALLSGLGNVYPYLQDGFLCECKNYSGSTISVTYVGKFASLLKVSNCKFGIMFSIQKVSGEKWSDGVGLIKKIALSDKIYILNFTIDDLSEIANGTQTFFSLINTKYNSLKYDIDFSKYILPHECESDFSPD